MCFDDDDETPSSIEGFRRLYRPFPDIIGDFRAAMDGILSGRNRILYARFGSVLRNGLEGFWINYAEAKWWDLRSQIFPRYFDQLQRFAISVGIQSIRYISVRGLQLQYFFFP